MTGPNFPDSQPQRSLYEAIYDVVRQIPPGQVATYGQIAAIANLAGKARLVGYALFRVPKDSDVPWQRVINAKGEISHSVLREGSDYVQRALLEDEGIIFDDNDKISLQRYQWRPDFPGDNSWGEDHP